MPRISSFYGIVIRMYFDDHGPPHFHAEYGEHCAKVEIATGEIYVGRLPRREARLVRAWAARYREDLEQNWALARARLPLVKIEPLR